MCMSVDQWYAEVQLSGGHGELSHQTQDLNTIPIPVYSQAVLLFFPANCTENIS